MEKQDYTYEFTTIITPEKALDAISRVPEWWASDFEDNSKKLNDEFTVRFGDVSVTFKVVEVVPGKNISWLVMDCNLNWLKNNKEWIGTRLLWEVNR